MVKKIWEVQQLYPLPVSSVKVCEQILMLRTTQHTTQNKTPKKLGRAMKTHLYVRFGSSTAVGHFWAKSFSRTFPKKSCAGAGGFLPNNYVQLA